MIHIRDDYATGIETYSGTHSDGKTLPKGLSIDPHTGMISGIIPENMIDEEGNILIEISAYNETSNETRTLKIKINIQDIQKNSNNDAPTASLSLDEQFTQENNKINNYGNNLLKLFSNKA